jgi:hypothetical protein
MWTSLQHNSIACVLNPETKAELTPATAEHTIQVLFDNQSLLPP